MRAGTGARSHPQDCSRVTLLPSPWSGVPLLQFGPGPPSPPGPREIVRYQVARVDHLLKTELNLPDGLADPSVYVLVPCCGTGAYLVETLRGVEENLRARGDADALLANDLKTAARTRLFGFELIPAPFVVAHLQIGLNAPRCSSPNWTPSARQPKRSSAPNPSWSSWATRPTTGLPGSPRTRRRNAARSATCPRPTARRALACPCRREKD